MTCTLFSILLVIQVSTAANGRTSTATSPFSTLDMGADTSFFDPLVAAELGWKVRKNAVVRPVRLDVVNLVRWLHTLLVEFYGPKCKLSRALHYISTNTIQNSSLF